MGRSCSIFGLRFKEMKSDLFLALEREDVTLRMEDLSSLFPGHHRMDELKQLITSIPEKLNHQDLALITTALSDPAFKGKRNKQKIKLPDLLESCGIFDLYHIGSTTACCVLMDIFCDWTNSRKKDLPEMDERMYLFSQEQFLSFAERVAQTGHYFINKTKGRFNLFKAISKEGLDFEKELEELYQRESKKRAANKLNYESKWSCDYFSAAPTYSSFFSAHLLEGNFCDRYFLWDSI